MRPAGHVRADPVPSGDIRVVLRQEVVRPVPHGPLLPHADQVHRVPAGIVLPERVVGPEAVPGGQALPARVVHARGLPDGHEARRGKVRVTSGADQRLLDGIYI